MTITLHQGDLPSSVELGPAVAVDTETMGLRPHRDKLCLVQLSSGDGSAHLVQVDRTSYEAPNLRRLFADDATLKLFHFARFDMAVIEKYLGVMPGPVYCTKIASKLVRTYTDRHGLKDLCREILSIDLPKVVQSSDWGAETLSQAQQEYAAGDVLYLHRLKAGLDEMLAREGRADLAEACFGFLATRTRLDLDGWSDEDIFAHSSGN
ncbi:MAG: ribonuclease D [Hyphomicrobiales bacterium]